MFEIWENLSDPGVWLVFRESPSFPGDFAVEEWVELGSCRVVDEIAIQIDADGYVTIDALPPFDPERVIGAEA